MEKTTTKTTKPKVKTVKAKVVKEAAPEVAQEVTEVKPAAAPKATKEPKVAEGSIYIEKGKYVFSSGRRKTATATVRVYTGKAPSTVGKKTLEKYFEYPLHISKVMLPLELTGIANTTYFSAVVSGGGIKSQSEAIAHAIAKAIVEQDSVHRLVLKKNGLLTRDDRKKERKKPGLKRARRRPQWAKR